MGAGPSPSEQTGVVTDVPDPAVSPSPPPHAAMTVRVADADRDRTVALLREHVVDGRLTLDEFSARVGLALQALVFCAFAAAS